MTKYELFLRSFAGGNPSKEDRMVGRFDTHEEAKKDRDMRLGGPFNRTEIDYKIEENHDL